MKCNSSTTPRGRVRQAANVEAAFQPYADGIALAVQETKAFEAEARRKAMLRKEVA